MDIDNVKNGLVVGFQPFLEPRNAEETASGHPEDALPVLIDIQDAPLEEESVPTRALCTLDSERLVGFPDGDSQAIVVGFHAGARDEIIAVQIRDEVQDISSCDQLVIEERHLFRLVSGQLAPEMSFLIFADARDGHQVALRKGLPPGDDAPLRLYEFFGEIAQQVRFVPICRFQTLFLDVPGGDFHLSVRHGEGDGTVFRQGGRGNGDNSVLAGHESFPGIGERGDGSVPSVVHKAKIGKIFAPFIPISPQKPGTRHSFMAERAGVGIFVET